MDNSTKAKELMEQGWKAREALNFEEAESKLLQAKAIFENEEDWLNVTECLNHLAYSYKLQALKLTEKGYEIAKSSLETATTRNSKIPSPLRANMSLAVSLGNFELALSTAKKLLAITEKPMNKADVLQHIAQFELRTGDAKKALETIETSLNLFKNHFEEERDPHRQIWKTAALMTKAQILLNLGDSSYTSILDEVEHIAKEFDLKSRIIQLNTFKELI